jgi:hypothetical protein
MMICAKDNGMSWVHLDDLLKYIIAPEQYQGVEPQLEKANLFVNLLTAPTPGRLTSLKREQENNDQFASKRRRSNPNDSFAS